MNLSDAHGRSFQYLRLSVTDRCNFKCAYCLPNGYQAPVGAAEPELSIPEIKRLVTAFSTMGLWKVRLTGGEPTIRRDIVELAHAVAAVPGIRKVAITTNGNRLKELAQPLRDAGRTAMNVSIDSLDSENFKNATGMDRLGEVLEGVEHALTVGFETVKINAVLLKETQTEELARFMEWVKAKPISVRFIELMQTGKNKEYFSKNHLSAATAQLELLKKGWVQSERKTADGPAVVYRHPQYEGSIGIIAPYGSGFCETCNRLRVTARGALKLCLFGDQDESLRHYLQDDESLPQLVQAVQDLVLAKPATHFLHEGKIGNTLSFSGIGG